MHISERSASTAVEWLKWWIHEMKLIWFWSTTSPVSFLVCFLLYASLQPSLMSLSVTNYLWILFPKGKKVLEETYFLLIWCICHLSLNIASFYGYSTCYCCPFTYFKMDYGLLCEFPQSCILRLLVQCILTYSYMLSF